MPSTGRCSEEEPALQLPNGVGADNFCWTLDVDATEAAATV